MTKKIYFSNLDFVNQLGIDGSFFNKSFSIDRKSLYGQYVDEEAFFMFNFVKKIKPKGIIEFSPCHGYTTIVINLGLASGNVDFDYFDTYEIDARCFGVTKNNLRNYGFEKTNVILGDVLSEMNLERLSKCDFLNIDSDHSKEFVVKYVDKFFPLIKKGAWLCIHDIGFTDDGPVNEETEVLVDYLNRNNITSHFFLGDLTNHWNIEVKSRNVLGNMSLEKPVALYIQL